MIPLSIDPDRLRIGLAARGPSGLRRLNLLRAGGASQVAVFCDQPDSDLARAAPASAPRLPEAADVAALDLLWITGIPPAEATPLARLARAQRVPVNVEDLPDLCDFHNAAEIRRGDLLITISTGGRNPGLAAAIRKALDRQFGPEWASRLHAATQRRADWRETGHDMPSVGALLEQFARSERWLP